jgi:hypothetical protein
MMGFKERTSVLKNPSMDDSELCQTFLCSDTMSTALSDIYARGFDPFK